jgi:hypothetical protein
MSGKGSGLSRIRNLALSQGRRCAHRGPDALLHFPGRLRRLALRARGLVPAIRVARDPQGLRRLQAPGVGHVPLHRLADGLLVTSPQHAPRQSADDLQGLLHIDYGFHVPLMIAAVVLSYSFLSLARSRRSEEPAPANLKANSEGPLATEQAR